MAELVDCSVVLTSVSVLCTLGKVLALIDRTVPKAVNAPQLGASSSSAWTWPTQCQNSM